MSRHRSRLVALVMTGLLAAACSISPPPPAPPSAPTTVRTPASVDYDRLRADLETALTSAGLGLDKTVDAVLVDVQGESKVALYRNGWRADQAMHVYSTTASVTAALIGIAIDEHLIGGLDDHLDELLPRYRTSMSPEVREITLRQLMDMTAGLPYDFAVDRVATIFSVDEDPVPGILAAPLDAAPGTTNFYSSRSAHLVTAVLREALARVDGNHPRTVLGYANEKLFAPLGIKTRSAFTGRAEVGDPAFDARTDFGWGTDAAGLNSGCCLLRLRPADMAKIGELFREDGLWQGTRILPAGWAATCTHRGKLSADFGLLWYTTTMRGREVWLTRGGEGQMIAVVPDRALVVTVASVGTEEFDIPEYDASSLLDSVILPAVG